MDDYKATREQVEWVRENNYCNDEKDIRLINIHSEMFSEELDKGKHSQELDFYFREALLRRVGLGHLLDSMPPQ